MNANAIRSRSGTLDSLHGLTLFSMIAYHLCWDLVYLRGLPWAWYNGFWAYIWQQSICCTFILLSGYCCQASRHPIRRGAISFFGGAAVSLATTLVTPEEPIRFGVLTFLGTAALLTAPLRSLLTRIPPRLGLVLSFSLFLLARLVCIVCNASWLWCASGQHASWLSINRLISFRFFSSSVYFLRIPSSRVRRLSL